jgi:hypothetical protein
MDIHPLVWSSLATAGLLGIEHYALARWLSRPLHAVINYILGVLAVIGPLSLALAEMGLAAAVLPLWLGFAAGGGAVVVFYGLDTLIDRLREIDQIRAQYELVQRQRDEVLDGDE